MKRFKLFPRHSEAAGVCGGARGFEVRNEGVGCGVEWLAFRVQLCKEKNVLVFTFGRDVGGGRVQDRHVCHVICGTTLANSLKSKYCMHEKKHAGIFRVYALGFRSRVSGLGPSGATLEGGASKIGTSATPFVKCEIMYPTIAPLFRVQGLRFRV